MTVEIPPEDVTMTAFNGRLKHRATRYECDFYGEWEETDPDPPSGPGVEAWKGWVKAKDGGAVPSGECDVILPTGQKTEILVDLSGSRFRGNGDFPE